MVNPAVHELFEMESKSVFIDNLCRSYLSRTYRMSGRTLVPVPFDCFGVERGPVVELDALP